MRELGALPKEVVRRIHQALLALEANARPPGAKKLTGREGWRIRVGDDRILYEIDDGAGFVRVYRIGPRRDVYR